MKYPVSRGDIRNEGGLLDRRKGVTIFQKKKSDELQRFLGYFTSTIRRHH
jgi:hypothetical protein